MNDRQVDAYILRQINKRKITLYDIIGGKYIDPTPNAVDIPAGQRCRWNRFSTQEMGLRLCELLTPQGFDEDDPFRRLAVPVKDLVRYWWNNCIDQELAVADIFEEIMEHYKDRMLPAPREPEARADVSDAFDKVLEAI